MNPSTSLSGHEARLEPLGRYFLFAGAHATSGGLGDLVSVFVDESEARAAFAGVRLQQDRTAEWAELAAVDAHGSIRLLCWFGHDRPVPHHGRLAGMPSTSPAAGLEMLAESAAPEQKPKP